MNLVQNFPISFKNPETFLKLPNFLDDMKITCLKATQKETKNIINNQTFLVKYPEKGEPMIPWMDVYKAKIQSDGILDKLKLRIVVRGDLQNN